MRRQLPFATAAIVVMVFATQALAGEVSPTHNGSAAAAPVMKTDGSVEYLMVDPDPSNGSVRGLRDVTPPTQTSQLPYTPSSMAKPDADDDDNMHAGSFHSDNKSQDNTAE